MLFTVALIAYFIVYGFTLLTAVVVVYHFNRFGIKKEFPGRFFLGALMFFSLLLAAVNMGMLSKIQNVKSFPLELPFSTDFIKNLPFPSFAP